MKLICDRQALYDALATVLNVVPSRTPKPILQCARLTATKEGLALTTYDQEVGMRYRLRAVEVDQPGEALVMAERLGAIVRESRDETLALETDEHVLHIRGTDSHFQILGQDVREFPPVPEAEGEPKLVVKLGALREAVECTVFAAARENTRYAINGVLWQGRGTRLQLVATDGRRLALSSAAIVGGAAEDVHAIVPTKALGLLGRLHAAVDEELAVQLTPNQIVLRTEAVTISSVLVEGHFPNWEAVIPDDLDKAVELPTADLLSGVRRVALLAGVESRGIHISLGPDAMVLTSRSSEEGEATVRLPIKYEQPPIEVAFNPEFLVDALRVCQENVRLELKEPSRPGVMTSGQNLKYVVMPVNL